MENKERNSKKILGHVFALFSVVVWGSCYVLTVRPVGGYELKIQQ